MSHGHICQKQNEEKGANRGEDTRGDEGLYLGGSNDGGPQLSDFVISSALSAAKDVIRTNAILELSKRDQVLFAETLITFPTPKEALVEAAGRFIGRKNR